MHNTCQKTRQLLPNTQLAPQQQLFNSFSRHPFQYNGTPKAGNTRHQAEGFTVSSSYSLAVSLFPSSQNTHKQCPPEKLDVVQGVNPYLFQHKSYQLDPNEHRENLELQKALFQVAALLYFSRGRGTVPFHNSTAHLHYVWVQHPRIPLSI